MARGREWRVIWISRMLLVDTPYRCEIGQLCRVSDSYFSIPSAMTVRPRLPIPYPSVRVVHPHVRSILARRGSQFLDVENVLLSSTCEFILDEVIFGYNDGSDFAVDKFLDSIFPRLIETDTVDVLQKCPPGQEAGQSGTRSRP
jgi:hypothetical protein